MAKRWRKGGQTASPQGRRDDLAARSRRPPTKGERGGELPGGVPVDSNGQTGRRQSATMAPPAANGQRPTARQARHDVDGNSSHLPPPPGPSSLPTNEWAPRLTREAPTSPLPPPPDAAASPKAERRQWRRQQRRWCPERRRRQHALAPRTRPPKKQRVAAARHASVWAPPPRVDREPAQEPPTRHCKVRARTRISWSVGGWPVGRKGQSKFMTVVVYYICAGIEYVELHIRGCISQDRS